MTAIEDHELRYQLANELHARPYPVLSVPGQCAYLAVKQPENAVSRDRGDDLAHLTRLLDRFGAPHPQPGATHYSGQIGRHLLKWEQHTEFVTYSVFTEGLGERPFDPGDFGVFPADWLAELPGVRVTSALIRVEPRPEPRVMFDKMRDWFVPESLALSSVLDGAAVLAGDFRIDSGGHMRFAVFAGEDTSRRRVGRVIQRLCEIETYKAMSMLGFFRAKGLSERLNAIDRDLTQLMDGMAGSVGPAEETLKRLLEISADVEHLSARNAFRFGATGAYEAIVQQRIEALRESRLEGRQTFAEFMTRRYDPAMRTVKSTEGRLQGLGDRAMRASDLLRTRVDVERSAHSQALLESMDRRADLQLRLQTTVEGLSVVAISYYAVSLAGYLTYPAAKTLEVGKEWLIAGLTLPVVFLVWLMIRRIRRKVH